MNQHSFVNVSKAIENEAGNFLSCTAYSMLRKTISFFNNSIDILKGFTVSTFNLLIIDS